MKYIISILLLTGCVTTPSRPPILFPNKHRPECPATTLINSTSEPINNLDRWTLDNAQKNCVNYYPASPCLKKLYKFEPRSYYAECGKP